MAADLVSTFETSLDGLAVTHERTTASALPAAVREAVVTPAVGAPLPWDDLTLDGSGVNLAPTAGELRDAASGVTAAGAAVASEGSLLVQSRPGGDELVAVYPPRHVAVVRERDVVADVPAAIDWLGGEFAAGRRSAVFATGPSATADMGELVEGVHGPGAVHVITVEER